MPSARSARLPDVRLALTLARQNALLVWFLLVDELYAGVYLAAPQRLGSDAVLYAAAARAWLTGGDPWQVTAFGLHFASTPPTLLFFAPFAFLSPVVVAAFWLLADGGAIVLVLRGLHLPFWWAFFPPIWEAGLAGNPEPVLLALLVSSSTIAGAVATLLKPYAFAPLLGERRYRAIAIAIVAAAATLIVLPWRQFLSDAPEVASTLALQNPGYSVLSVPWLLPVGILGLVGLGFNRAMWLIVPVMWPNTQLHYATIAVPRLAPNLLAFGFSLPLAGAPAVAVAAQAGLERWRARRHRTDPWRELA